MSASLSPRPLHHHNNISEARRASLTGDKALNSDAYNKGPASPNPSISSTLTPPSCNNTDTTSFYSTIDMNTSGASVSAVALRRAQRNIQAGLSQSTHIPDIIETSTERRGSGGSTSLALVSPKGYHYIRHNAHERSEGLGIQISPRAVMATVPYRSRAKSLSRKPAPPLPDVIEQPQLEQPIRRNATEASHPAQPVQYEFLLHPPPTATAHTQIIRRSKSRPNLQNLTCGILGSKGAALANFDDLEYQFRHIQQLQEKNRRSTSSSSRTSSDLQVSVEVVKEEFGLNRADSKSNKRRSWKSVVNRARSGSLGSRLASLTQPLSPSTVGVAY
ncbi:hypothetical protein FRC03_011519 [Tulasnella sp. 419]|nr:hypothetical protein FRC02_008490 [Tulasnella sp. 418]KAG8966684.1 hypothetical protein FRC03_011519 [Tulasnella sp. 419]